MKRSQYIYIFITISLCVWVTLYVWSYHKKVKNRNAYIAFHKMAYSESKMKNLASEIQGLAEINQDKVPTNITELIVWFLSDPLLVECLKDDMYFKKLVETGKFHDEWNNPVKLVVESPRKYIFISSGANGKDENGKGDDITYAFDPLEMRLKGKEQVILKTQGTM